MEAYATIEDLQSGWRELSAIEKQRFEPMLEQASVFLYTLLKKAGKPTDPDDEPYAELLRDVTCNLVRRSEGEAWNSEEPTEWNQYTAPTYQEFTPARQRRDFYLTKWERLTLGIASARLGSVGMGE